MSQYSEYEADAPLGISATVERISNEQAILDELNRSLLDVVPTPTRTKENLDDLRMARKVTMRKIGEHQLFLVSRSENQTL